MSRADEPAARDPIRHEALWRASSSPDEFGASLSDAWCRRYVEETGADVDDIVTVDPGNGFHYDFDLAGTMRGAETERHPRVIGVWGRSRAPASDRDHQRMRGHPRRGVDDRGHLVAHSAGGEYDINLVPMEPLLNRGWSAEGRRFRAMERLAAAHPGSLYFVHLEYGDHTDRPARLVVGVEHDGDLVVDDFANPASQPRVSTSPLRRAVPLTIERGAVADLVSVEHDARDELFERAWTEGIGRLTRRERNLVAGVTGHVAESLAAVLLVERGWQLLWQFTTTGRHGVDLVVLSPDDRVVVVEVKGTLVPGRIPRLSRRQLAQMTAAWVDKPDNPGMQELGIEAADVLGAVVVVNLADLSWRAAFTTDFETLHPVEHPDQLRDLGWLDRSAGEAVVDDRSGA